MINTLNVHIVEKSLSWITTVKTEPEVITLAIGDGANDVNMI